MADQNKVFDKKKKSARRNSILKPTSLSREPLQVSEHGGKIQIYANQKPFS